MLLRLSFICICTDVCKPWRGNLHRRCVDRKQGIVTLQPNSLCFNALASLHSEPGFEGWTLTRWRQTIFKNLDERSGFPIKDHQTYNMHGIGVASLLKSIQLNLEPIKPSICGNLGKNGTFYQIVSRVLYIISCYNIWYDISSFAQLNLSQV